MNRERARITIQDLVYVVMSLGFLAALYPVVYDGLQENSSEFSVGVEYLMQLILPMALLVLLWMVWRKALVGV